VLVTLAQIIDRIAQKWGEPGFHIIVGNKEACGQLWSELHRRHGGRHLSLPAHQNEISSFQSQLMQTFLGEQEIVWCEPEKGSRKQAKLLGQLFSFLFEYKGPHAVWMLCDEEKAKEIPARIKRYVLPDQCSFSDISALARWWGYERAETVLAHIKAMKQPYSCTVDEACTLVRHAEFLPMRNAQKAEAYLTAFYASEYSLYDLADLYFSGKKEAFFKRFSEVVDRYGDMFWIAFWGEQLWRAYWVCVFMQKGQQTRARAMSFRLPRSFLNGAWRRYSLETLAARYEQLFFFDSCVKKGSLFALYEFLVVSLGTP
jgi:hypothetical protein